MENAHPQGYAGKLLSKANSPLADPERENPGGRHFSMCLCKLEACGLPWSLERGRARGAAACAGLTQPWFPAGFGALRHLQVTSPAQGRELLSQAGDLPWHQTASTLINVFLLLLFQGAKGLSASETNGKRRPWQTSPSHTPKRPT